MSRQVTLNAVQAGMTRLRDKGGANPNSLFELTNGYVTAARTMRVRPGTVRHAVLPPETRGLCVYQGVLTTFSHRSVSVPQGYALEIIGHPTQPDLALSDIHFAAPFMGFLYVVAEFANGDTFHFWLERAVPWTPSALVITGQTVSPTQANGYIYQATRTAARSPTWQPQTLRAVGDVVEPTVENGFRYRVVETFGSRPASGAAEPAWPTVNGQRVVESNEVAPPPPGETQPGFNPNQPIIDAIGRRYPFGMGAIP